MLLVPKTSSIRGICFKSNLILNFTRSVSCNDNGISICASSFPPVVVFNAYGSFLKQSLSIGLSANFTCTLGTNAARCLCTSGRFSQIEVRKTGGDVSSQKKEKVKEAAKTTTYGLIIVAGVSCIGFVLYILYKELFSKAGPTKVFGDALEKCRNHQELTVAIGSPIQGYGETNSRGRRRHVSHLAYIDAHGRDAMRMKFYVKGSSGRTGTVQVDSVTVRGKISYRYIVAYLDTYPRRVIIILDERSGLDKDGDATPDL